VAEHEGAVADEVCTGKGFGEAAAVLSVVSTFLRTSVDLGGAVLLELGCRRVIELRLGGACAGADRGGAALLELGGGDGRAIELRLGGACAGVDLGGAALLELGRVGG
jgi:hypothetical protein